MNKRIQILNSGLTSLGTSFNNRAQSMAPNETAYRFFLNYQVMSSIVQEITTKINQTTEPAQASALLEQKYKEIEPFLNKLSAIDLESRNVGHLLVGELGPVIVNELIHNTEGIKDSFAAQMTNLEANVLGQVNEGIKQLTKIKEGLNLEQNYGQFLTDKVKGYKISKWSHYIAFILMLSAVSVMSIGILMTVAKESNSSNVDWHILLVRILILLPFLWIAKFLHENYKQAFIGEVKFENIKHLVGGGLDSVATYIADPEAKQAAFTKFGNSIVDMSDMINLISNRTFNPEDVLNQAKSFAEIINGKKDYKK